MCVIIELDSQSFVRFEKVLYYSDYSCLSYILSYPKFMFLYLWLIISDNIIRQFTRLLFFSIQYLLLIKQNLWNPLNWWLYQQLSYVQGDRNALGHQKCTLNYGPHRSCRSSVISDLVQSPHMGLIGRVRKGLNVSSQFSLISRLLSYSIRNRKFVYHRTSRV